MSSRQKPKSSAMTSRKAVARDVEYRLKANDLNLITTTLTDLREIILSRIADVSAELATLKRLNATLHGLRKLNVVRVMPRASKRKRNFEAGGR